MVKLAEELTNIGIALQSGSKAKPLNEIQDDLQKIYDEYFDLRATKLNTDTLENFMVMRLILVRISKITSEISTIYKIFSQNQKLAKSLSTGLDLAQFVPNQQKLNSKVFGITFL